MTEFTMNHSKMLRDSLRTMNQIEAGSDQEENLIRDVLVKTLCLMCDLNLQIKDILAARKNLKDLDNIQKNEAFIYILKVKVVTLDAVI